MTVNGIYSSMAALLEYPWDDIREKAQGCLAAVEGPSLQYPSGVSEELKAFMKEAFEMPLDDLQGLYSYTFEISGGETTLDLAYHLYDGFKRSNYLVSLKELYKAKSFPFAEIAKGELPDHLPVVLRFLDILDDEGLRREILESFVIKGMEKLAKNFDISSSKDSPYRHVIKALWLVIDTDIKRKAASESEQQ